MMFRISSKADGTVAVETVEEVAEPREREFRRPAEHIGREDDNDLPNMIGIDTIRVELERTAWCPTSAHATEAARLIWRAGFASLGDVATAHAAVHGRSRDLVDVINAGYPLAQLEALLAKLEVP